MNVHMCDPSYRTKDLYCAAWLNTRGHILQECRREGHQCVFIFSSSPALNTDAAAFLSNSATVSAFEFAVNLRTLKGLTAAARQAADHSTQNRHVPNNSR